MLLSHVHSLGYTQCEGVDSSGVVYHKYLSPGKGWSCLFHFIYSGLHFVTALTNDFGGQKGTNIDIVFYSTFQNVHVFACEIYSVHFYSHQIPNSF